jgi:predicted N-acetyltransferase YhbS
MSIDWDLCTIVTPLSPAEISQIVTATRAAFRGAEPVPGLPTADGALENAASVAEDLRAGAWLAVARDRSGRIVGSVRAFAEPSGAWVVRRLAVLPRLRGTGLARALMRHLEEAAAAAGAPIVRLDAVVERGNPPFYAGLGYTTTAHFPSPDKPLSEVAMHRELGLPRARLRYPWDGESAPQRFALLVTWHTDGAQTMARIHTNVDSGMRVAGEPVDGYTFAGADGYGYSYGHDDPAVARLAREALGAGVFDAAPAAVAAFRMPRTVHPGLLALWRPRTW